MTRGRTGARILKRKKKRRKDKNKRGSDGLACGFAVGPPRVPGSVGCGRVVFCACSSTNGNRRCVFHGASSAVASVGPAGGVAAGAGPVLEQEGQAGQEKEGAEAGEERQPSTVPFLMKLPLTISCCCISFLFAGVSHAPHISCESEGRFHFARCALFSCFARRFLIHLLTLCVRCRQPTFPRWSFCATIPYFSAGKIAEKCPVADTLSKSRLRRPRERKRERELSLNHRRSLTNE
jgi:hypothetical protein